MKNKKVLAAIAVALAAGVLLNGESCRRVYRDGLFTDSPCARRDSGNGAFGAFRATALTFEIDQAKRDRIAALPEVRFHSTHSRYDATSLNSRGCCGASKSVAPSEASNTSAPLSGSTYSRTGSARAGEAKATANTNIHTGEGLAGSVFIDQPDDQGACHPRTEHSRSEGVHCH